MPPPDQEARILAHGAATQGQPQPLPWMTRRQAENYERFLRSVSARGLPEQVRIFLVTLREHQLRAGLTGRELARRAATREGAPQQGEPAPRPAPAGYDRDGRFSDQRLSVELTGLSRIPRPVLVTVIAEAYAQCSGEPAHDVTARLEALRVDAERAAGRQEHQRRHRSPPPGESSSLPHADGA